jgi:uncharacterized membrane protein
MERTAIPGLAHGDHGGTSAGRLQELRRRLVPLALAALRDRWKEAATYAAALSGAAVFAQLALLQHRRFESTAYDFGFFDQIIWNTAHGRFFETSFVPYNFLGLHFEPVLLVFAALYRLGAGVESLLVVQAAFVGAAAVPLYYAVRRMSGSSLAALAMALAFLLTSSLHRALDFGFHPEMMGFVFVFLALYYLAAGHPWATIISLLPLLALKEDMPLILGAFAVLLFLGGYRRHAGWLALLTVGWTVALFNFVMPALHSGHTGLTDRYEYLFSGSSAVSFIPHVLSRGFQHVHGELIMPLQRLLPAAAVALLAPTAALLVVPPVLLAALSDHTQQAHLELQYVMIPLALAFVAASVGVRMLARGDGVARGMRRLGSPTARAVSGAGVMLAATLVSFALSSPYWPAAERVAPGPAHVEVLNEALSLVPADVPVSAQNTILPHVSQRRSVYEFPWVEDSQYVIVDATLPITSQSREAGYDEAAKDIPGFEKIFDSDGVRVFRRLQ